MTLQRIRNVTIFLGSTTDVVAFKYVLIELSVFHFSMYFEFSKVNIFLFRKKKYM